MHNILDMKEIIISGNKYNGVIIVDDEDFELVNKYKWYLSNHQYACTKQYEGNYNKTTYMHKLIKGLNSCYQTDHINRDTFDNRKSNLRLVTHRQNLLNQASTKGTSKYKGVSYHKKDKKWRARIYVNKKCKFLGNFDTQELAAIAYDNEAKVAFGEYAYLNFK